MVHEKTLYRCPKCGDILTEKEWNDSFVAGGNGLCPCEFRNGSRIYYGYDVYDIRNPRQPREESPQ